MEMTSAILTVIYIVMLNCFLNKKLILNEQLIKYNIKVSKIFSIKSRENYWDFIWKWWKNYDTLG